MMQGMPATGKNPMPIQPMSNESEGPFFEGSRMERDVQRFSDVCISITLVAFFIFAALPAFFSIHIHPALGFAIVFLSPFMPKVCLGLFVIGGMTGGVILAGQALGLYHLGAAASPLLT